MPSHCLDTNVLLYAFSTAPHDAAKANTARDWISREDWGVPVQVLQEFYVNAVRAPGALSHDDALAMIEEIASSRPVAATDLPLLRHALQLKDRYGIAYWDAAVVAGARRLGASVLVTEDLSDGQNYGGVRVVNPFA
ncbi:MAG: PIN domain-containing protein [Burkholderiales bacterium]|nr:PIN domain-containing protein [Burkholderiales bacterium]